MGQAQENRNIGTVHCEAEYFIDTLSCKTKSESISAQAAERNYREFVRGRVVFLSESSENVS